MAGGMGGGGGGGGGGSGSALGDQQPLAQTAGNDFSGNAMSPGGSPAQFVDNAMSGGGSPASVVGGPNDPVTQAQTQGLYAYAGSTPPSPAGTQSGGQQNWGSSIAKIAETLFGSNKANASSLPNVAGRAPTASAGWPMAGGAGGGPGGSPGGTDPYGNTYTTQPGYQGSVAHPLPPYSPSAAAAPAATAPASQPTAQPGAADAGGGGDKGKITPAEPTPSVATDVPLLRPRPAEADATPAGVPPLSLNVAQSYMDPATAAGASSELTGQSPTAFSTASKTVDPTGQGRVEVVSPTPAPEQDPETVFGDRTVVPGSIPYPGRSPVETAAPSPAPGTPPPPAQAEPSPAVPPSPYRGDRLDRNPKGDRLDRPAAPFQDRFGQWHNTPEGASEAGPAPVSPQSRTAPGNTPAAPTPDSPIGKLLQGDFSGAFTGLMRSLTGQLGTSPEQNMIGKGGAAGAAPPPFEVNRALKGDRLDLPSSPDVNRALKGDRLDRPAPQTQVQPPATPAPGGTAAAATAPPGVPQWSGGTAQHMVANTLARGGAQPNAIAGIMANIGPESSFNRNARNPTSGARGLVQFSPTGEELGAYKAWLTQNGQLHQAGNPQNQMKFLTERLKTAYPQTWAKMNAAQSPAQAAEIFAREYERPGAADLNRRILQFRNQGVSSVDQQLGGLSNRSQQPSIGRDAVWTNERGERIPAPGQTLTKPPGDSITIPMGGKRSEVLDGIRQRQASAITPPRTHAPDADAYDPRKPFQTTPDWYLPPYFNPLAPQASGEDLPPEPKPRPPIRGIPMPPSREDTDPYDLPPARPMQKPRRAPVEPS